MSVKIMSLVWEHAPYSEGSLLVLLALADWADDNGVSWPSNNKLAHKARLQRRRVQYIVRKLQADDFIGIEEGGGRKKQHKYTMNLEKLKGAFIAPFQNGALGDKETVHFGAERVHSETQTVHPSAPDPLVEPLEEPSLDPSAILLDSLKSNPAYGHIDIDMEYRRMQTWAETNRRRVTPRFVVNWLNRIEVPLSPNGHRKPVEPVVPLRPKSSAEYIENFERGLKIAPNYDISKDISMIPDDVVRLAVEGWYDGIRTQGNGVHSTEGISERATRILPESGLPSLLDRTRM